MKYDFVNSILHGSAQDKLKTLESDSVDCCITSPPYWALRDYKTPGQLGLEPTFQEYITKLVDIFSQVRRVLKKSGACWVNMGDTYGGPVTGDPEGKRASYQATKLYLKGVPSKSLCLIPERFAIAMLDEDSDDDYELNDDVPAWVKQEIEGVLSTKQLNGYVEQCHSKTQRNEDNTMLNIQRNGKMNIEKDIGTE